MITNEQRIAQANQRLKSANVGFVIQQLGDRLYLRGTLPPRPDSSKHQPYQQRIALGALGIRANPIGVKEAELEAHKVGGLVGRSQFDWKPYLRKAEEPCVNIGDWVARYKADYFTRRASTPQSLTTWESDYEKSFKRLPSHVPLSPQILKEAIISTAPDTKTRARLVMVLGRLAKFAGLELDFKPLKGSYSSKKTVPRNLPPDEEVARIFHQIQDPAWRWAYGMMAAYGLRNHEIFHLDLSQFPMVFITQGKTGTRNAWALYPEWANQWELENVKMPNCTGKNNSELGNRVTHAFKRLGVPFHPYNLRHAWAIRAIAYGLDVSLAAQQMGHSVQVHTDTYQRWISQELHEQTVKRLQDRSDRPMPPSDFLA